MHASRILLSTGPARPARLVSGLLDSSVFHRCLVALLTRASQNSPFTNVFSAAHRALQNSSFTNASRFSSLAPRKTHPLPMLRASAHPPPQNSPFTNVFRCRPSSSAKLTLYQCFALLLTRPSLNSPFTNVFRCRPSSSAKLTLYQCFALLLTRPSQNSPFTNVFGAVHRPLQNSSFTNASRFCSPGPPKTQQLPDSCCAAPTRPKLSSYHCFGCPVGASGVGKTETALAAETLYGDERRPKHSKKNSTLLHFSLPYLPYSPPCRSGPEATPTPRSS
jgi:hypothetical protein